MWTNGYESAEAVLVYARDGVKPRGFKDLAGASVAYVEASGLESTFAPVRRGASEVLWEPKALPSADALLALVDEGRVDTPWSSSIDARSAATSTSTSTRVPVRSGTKRELAWAVDGRQTALALELDAFFSDVRKDGTLARLVETTSRRAGK